MKSTKSGSSNNNDVIQNLNLNLKTTRQSVSPIDQISAIPYLVDTINGLSIEDQRNKKEIASLKKKDKDKQDSFDNLYSDINTKYENLNLKLDKDVSNFDEKLKEANLKSVETLGIFVAIFAYISISIQIFNRISHLWSAALFMFYLLCTFIIMICTFDLLLSKPVKRWDYRYAIIIICVVLGLVGTWFLKYKNFKINPIPDSQEFNEYIKNNFQDQINSAVDIKMNEFKECVYRKGIRKCV